MIIKLLGERPAPAAVQCIANLLDSPGGLKFFHGPAKPRDIMAAARANGVGAMGIRAVQAGALTSAIDRLLPVEHPEMRDFTRAAGFRRLAEEIGITPAALAHRYALSLDVDTLVLGVKNRQELAECVAAAEAGPLPPKLMARVDEVVARGEQTQRADGTAATKIGEIAIIGKSRPWLDPSELVIDGGMTGGARPRWSSN